MKKTARQWWHLYVDDAFVDTILSGWSINRIMTELRKKNPDAKRLEVRKHEDDSSTHLLKALNRRNEILRDL